MSKSDTSSQRPSCPCGDINMNTGSPMEKMPEESSVCFLKTKTNIFVEKRGLYLFCILLHLFQIQHSDFLHRQCRAFCISSSKSVATAMSLAVSHAIRSLSVVFGKHLLSIYYVLETVIGTPVRKKKVD